MSEVTLHGYPVKVGDRVWSIFEGFTEISKIDVGSTYKFLAGQFYFTSYGKYQDDEFPSLFWQPIDPSAIEAAKVKPKPVEYEWQFLYEFKQNDNTVFNTTGFFKDAQLAYNHLSKCLPGFIKLGVRIEESKREVKP